MIIHRREAEPVVRNRPPVFLRPYFSKWEEPCLWIFIVEDDAVIASAVEGHLRSWGWDARCAGDFGNILAEFAAFDPQLVLMDISLPSYNGYHWCGQIRQVSRVPVIFISSAAEHGRG